MKTIAAIAEGAGTGFVFDEVELDDPRAGEVLVRIVATGLCHTDLTVPTVLPAEMFPKVLRHEGTGVVEAVGPEVTDPQASRRAEAERYGARALDPTEEGAEPIEERVKAATGGGASYAIDTTALPAVVLQAQHALRPRGVLVALGLGAAEYTIDTVDLLQAGKVVRSSVEGEADPQQMVPELIRMRADGCLRRGPPRDDVPVRADRGRDRRRRGRQGRQGRQAGADLVGVCVRARCGRGGPGITQDVRPLEPESPTATLRERTT